MTDNAELEISSDPCAYLGLPKVIEFPNIPSVTLPLLGNITGYADFSLGPPNQCSLTFNLLSQLAPLLASLKCVSEILGIITALKKFATNPLGNGPGLLEAINKAEKCILQITLPNPCFVITIHGTLDLIINFLSCLISQVDSLAEFQVKLDWEAAKGNPVLEASLSCAQENAKASMKNLNKSLEPVKTTFNLIKEIGGLAGINELNDISLDLSLEDPVELSKRLKEVKAKLDDIKKTLEGLVNAAKSVCFSS